MDVHVWDGGRAIRLLAKALVTALLLFVAFRAVNVVAVSKLISRLNASWATAALGLTALIIISDAVLLERMMGVFGRRIRFGTAMLYSFVGWFFSNVAPSTVGGDVFRGVQLSRLGMSPGAAARLVVAIRILSFATLVIVMLIGFPIALTWLSASQDALLLASVIVAAAGAMSGLFSFAHLAPHLPALQRFKFIRKIDTMAADLRKLVVPGASLAIAWPAAFVQHLLRVATLACLAAGLRLGIPFAILFALTPAALLIAMLPISFGGWGVRELTFVYLLGAAGINAERALSLSIAFGLLRVVVGALGGLTWVMLNDDHFRVDASARIADLTKR